MFHRDTLVDRQIVLDNKTGESNTGKTMNCSDGGAFSKLDTLKNGQIQVLAKEIYGFLGQNRLIGSDSRMKTFYHPQMLFSV